MKSVIICEGNDDLTLIQYFLEKAHGWDYIKKSDTNLYPETSDIFNKVNNLKWLKYGDSNFIAIISAGGVNKIKNIVNSILDINTISNISLPYDKIVIITDRDEICTETEFLSEQISRFKDYGVIFGDEVVNNKWQQTDYTNGSGDNGEIYFLPLIIPFEATGALETFLLNALKKDSLLNDINKVDKLVIDQCEQFIENIDSKGKYLKKRRHITKAKFHTYFVVVAPKEAFGHRDSILRGIPWEEYEDIQSCFKELEKLRE